MAVDFERINYEPIERYYVDGKSPAVANSTKAAGSGVEGRVHVEGVQRLKVVSLENEPLDTPFEITKILIKYSNNPDGLPPLLYAIKRNDFTAVKIMLKYGADPHTRALCSIYWGQPGTPMEYACAYSTVEMVSIFLESGVTAESSPSGNQVINSPFLVATAFNNIHVLNFLISIGFEKSISQSTLNWALYTAAMKEYTTVVEILLKNGANPLDPLPTFRNKCCWQLLSSNVGILALFIKCGFVNVDFNEIVQGSPLYHRFIDSSEVNEVFTLLFEKGKLNLDAKDSHGCTIVHRAVERGNVLLLDWLVKAGADLNIKNNAGRAPLTIAKEVRQELVCYLIEKGANWIAV